MVVRQAQAEQAVRRENAMYFVEDGQKFFELDVLENILGLKYVDRARREWATAPSHRD